MRESSFWQNAAAMAQSLSMPLSAWAVSKPDGSLLALLSICKPAGGDAQQENPTRPGRRASGTKQAGRLTEAHAGMDMP